jgi:HPr kinase/phosphorylase
MPHAELNLIIQLKAMSSEQLAAVDRLRASRDTVIVLGKEVPRITLPVAPGRNLAILAETAVRSHMLLLDGCDAAADFSRRQQCYLLQGDS